MDPDGRIALASRPWWQRAQALAVGEHFIVQSTQPGGGRMLVRREQWTTRGKPQPVIVWVIDDDGDMRPDDKDGDKDSDCYVADYDADGTVDRMVDYLDNNADGKPDEMEIRYFDNGRLRRAWFGMDLDGDGHMWKIDRYEYPPGSFFECDAYGDNMIYFNGYDAARRAWFPASECPFAFHDTDGDGQSEAVVRVSGVPLSFDPASNKDPANDVNYSSAPRTDATRDMGAVNVRYGIDIDGLSDAERPLHYDLGFNMIGRQPYRFDGHGAHQPAAARTEDDDLHPARLRPRDGRELSGRPDRLQLARVQRHQRADRLRPARRRRPPLGRHLLGLGTTGDAQHGRAGPGLEHPPRIPAHAVDPTSALLLPRRSADSPQRRRRGLDPGRAPGEPGRGWAKSAGSTRTPTATSTAGRSTARARPRRCVSPLCSTPASANCPAIGTNSPSFTPRSFCPRHAEANQRLMAAMRRVDPEFAGSEELTKALAAAPSEPEKRYIEDIQREEQYLALREKLLARSAAWLAKDAAREPLTIRETDVLADSEAAWQFAERIARLDVAYGEGRYDAGGRDPRRPVQARRRQGRPRDADTCPIS